MLNCVNPSDSGLLKRRFHGGECFAIGLQDGLLEVKRGGVRAFIDDRDPRGHVRRVSFDLRNNERAVVVRQIERPAHAGFEQRRLTPGDQIQGVPR